MEEQGDYIVQGMINGITELPAKLQETLATAINTVTEWGSNMLTKAKEVITTMLNGIVTIVQETPQKIWNSITDAVNRVATWGTNMLNKAREVMNAMVTAIVDIVKEVPQKIYNAVSGAISKIATWGNEVKAKAVEGMNNAVTGIKNAFANIGNDFKTIGGNIVTGIWNGISAGWDWLKDKVKNIANSLLDAAKDALGIESPSKKFRDEVGVYAAQGIGVGFQKEMGSVSRLMQDSIPTEFDLNPRVNLTPDIAAAGAYGSVGTRAAGGLVVNQYIYANEQDYARQQREAARNFKTIARAVYA